MKEKPCCQSSCPRIVLYGNILCRNSMALSFPKFRICPSSSFSILGLKLLTICDQLPNLIWRNGSKTFSTCTNGSRKILFFWSISKSVLFSHSIYSIWVANGLRTVRIPQAVFRFSVVNDFIISNSCSSVKWTS